MSDAYNDALDKFLFDTMRVKEELDETRQFVEDYLKVRDNHIWETREGKKIPVSKMENSHLKNTIRYLERRENQLAKEEEQVICLHWINIFKCELKFRSIGAKERELERKNMLYNDIIAIL